MNSQDIAKLAGVSQSTVSRVMNRPELVNPTTRAKVEAVIQQQGFRPNLAAKMLAGQKHSLIAFVIDIRKSDLSVDREATFQAYFMGVAGEFLRVASTSKLTLSIFYIYDEFSASELLHLAAQSWFSALIGVGSYEKAPLWLELAEYSPVALLDIYSTSPHPQIITLNTDNLEGGYLAAKYLHAHGAQQFIHIAGSQHKISSAQRAQGFMNYVREQQLPSRQPIFVNYIARQAIQATREILSQEKDPSKLGLFIVSDVLLDALLHTLPELRDSTLVGFDATSHAGNASVTIDYAAMAQVGMATLQAMLRGEKDIQQNIQIATFVVNQKR